MSKVNSRLTSEKPMSQRLAEKRTAQDADAAMLKEAPPTEAGEDVVMTPGAIQVHPLEAAAPHMDSMMTVMEQVREILAKSYHAIEKVKKTGDTSHFLDQQLGTNPEAWEKKAKEVESILNKLILILPTR